MSLTLELPPELESELAAEAARLGLSLSDYAVRLLADSQPAKSPSRSGAEMVAYLQAEGVIGSRSDITDPVAFARELRRQAETRK